MLFFKKKQKVSSKELAEKLAAVFSGGIQQLLLDRSKLQWMWDALPRADAKSVARELAVAHMFLTTCAFHNYSRERKEADMLLDYFHSYALHYLTQMGLMQSVGDSEGFLRERYQDYYQAIRGSKDVSLQIDRIAETFFRVCGGGGNLSTNLCRVRDKDLHRNIEWFMGRARRCRDRLSLKNGITPLWPS
jgi:hypothetical protein